MFKQQAITKLPTFLQFMKENELKDVDFVSQIDKVLWGDQWRSITFQTREFRYSIKFNTEEEYREAINQVLDAFKPATPMSAWVIYTAESGEVEIDWVCVEPEDNSEQIQFKQWDWGLVADAYKAPSLAPASKKKPSAKLTRKAVSTEEQSPF